MAKLSQEFISKLILHPKNMYEIAQEAGVDQSFLSKAKNGIIEIRQDDERILRVASIIKCEIDEIFMRPTQSNTEKQRGEL